MRRSCIWFWVLAMALALSWAPLASAQTEGDEQTNKEPPRARRHRPQFTPRLGGVQTRHDARRFEKLHEAVNTELSLSGEQKATIDAMFEEYIKSLSGPGQQTQRLAPENRAKWKELREQARAARKAGDQEALKRLREQIRGSITDWHPSEAAAAPDEFVAKVEKELDQDQVRRFHKLLQQFRIGSYANKPTAALRRLQRAVMKRSGIKLSADQRLAVEQIIRDAEAKLDAAADDEAGKAVVAGAHKAIADLLSDKQRAQFDRNIEKLEIADHVARPGRRVQPKAAEDEAKDQSPPPDAEGQGDSHDDSGGSDDNGGGSNGGGG